MTVKNEIIANLVTLITTNIPEFKYVKRGLVSVADRQIQYPSCFLNSYKVSLNNDLTSFNSRRAYAMIVTFNILGKTRTDYFIELDNLEDKLIKYIDNISEPSVIIHPNVIQIVFNVVQELINDKTLDGLYELQLQATIDYTA